MLKKVPINARMPRQKRFKVGDGEWLVRVIFFYTLLVFDSLQFSVNYPTASVLPARRVSRDLTLSREIRRSRQACSIMKRLECRVLGRAPGNPLACFWSCRQYYEARYCKNTPCCCSDLQSTTLFVERYSYIIPVKLPDYSRIMLYAFADRLFRKLCRHIRRISRDGCKV